MKNQLNFRKYIIFTTAVLAIFSFYCNDNSVDVINKSLPGEWLSLGLNNKTIYNMVCNNTMLYVCTGKDGLWKKDISSYNNNWQYLGLADTSGLYPPKYVVSDIDVYKDTLLAAMFWLNIREEYQDAGIWKSTNNGISWNRVDSGIARSNFPYSSMWAVKRSPFYPAIIISTVGSIFRSNNSAIFWSQVYPADSTYRNESFVHNIAWNPKKANEVWVYGQGNTFDPSIEVSRDAGKSWENIQVNINNETPIYKIAFDAVKDNFMYMACYYGILSSDSAGMDWNNQNWQSPPYILSSKGYFAFKGLAANPVTGGEAYFAGGNNLYITKNYGKDFYVNKIPENLMAGVMIYCEKRDLIIITTNNGVFGFQIHR